MFRQTKKSLMLAALCCTLFTGFTGSALAFPEVPPPPPPPPPPPVSNVICHNIGGPRDLGANCEATGNCTVPLVGGSLLTFSANQFLGILIGAKGENAQAAHIAHGDGFAHTIFEPPLHLASVIGPHRASNVECLATRVIPQPEEPGN
ncbi:MAG: hypothetical protein M3R16_11100 [Pseudomonadota bacterium]|nr:hypothetical protein [Pseudomonadota bacterium]